MKKMRMQESLIEQILGTLTLEEKSAMLHGVSFFRSGAVEDKDIPAVETSEDPYLAQELAVPRTGSGDRRR